MNISSNKITNIHFIGIGGSGMSGLAEVLLNLGYTITGSDIEDSKVIKRLKALGAIIHLKHKISNLDNTQLIVTSSAIKKTNEEIVEAKKRSLPILERAEMLSSLMNMKKGIAVAGTHGKTTTTSILASIFTEADYDPTFIVGGILNNFSTNAKLGKGDYLIVEADESDKSFLMLQPTISIITNIDNDHLVNYGNKFSNLENAFVQFAKKLPFNGFLVVWGDDPVITKLIPRFSRKVVTYGFGVNNDYILSNFSSKSFKSKFLLSKKQKPLISVNLNMIGKHNALNAAAASVLALEEGIKIELIDSALKSFSGIARRMQFLGSIEKGGFSSLLFDDYGHHPTEIKTTVETIRESFPNRKIIMVFQPHRYSRMKDLFKEFLEALQLVDELLILEVYSAGENRIKGYNSLSLSVALRKLIDIPIHLPKEESEVVKILESSLNNQKSILLIQGAGNISSLASSLYKRFKK